MSSPANPVQPPFVADILGRIECFGRTVVSAVMARDKAEHAAAVRLLNSNEIIPDCGEELGPFLTAFVERCTAGGARHDAATGAAVAVRDCGRRLRALLPLFPTIHTENGKNELAQLWQKHYGHDDPAEIIRVGGEGDGLSMIDNDLLNLSIELNHLGMGGRETVGDAVARIRRSAEDEVKAMGCALASDGSDCGRSWEGVSFPSATEVEYDGLRVDVTQSEALVLRAVLRLRGGRDVPVDERAVIREAKLNTTETRTHRTAINKALKTLGFPKKLSQRTIKEGGARELLFEPLKP